MVYTIPSTFIGSYMKKYILALDQGTTSCRAVLFDKNTNPIASESWEFTQYYPQAGWVEHDAEEIFKTQLSVMKKVLQKAYVKSEEIGAIGITNQRETIVVWDKNTGKPVCPAIVWQCRRTASLCDELIAQGWKDKIKEKTGLLIDAYFSATKLQWIFDHNADLLAAAKKGNILCGTIDTWLIWKLSGGKQHVTDVTNASRTMLFNIHTLQWDTELLDLFGIPACILPKVKDSSCIYCTTHKDICGFEIPIASAIGDQQAALFGQGCFSQGEGKNTYGTGCFLLMNTGDTPISSKNNLLTTIALGLNGKITYALEGSIFMGGAIIKWLRDELELIETAKECDILAESVPNANGAFLVPAFTGLGAPYWDMYARGTFVGLTRGVKKAHLCRATLESIAFQVKDVVSAMQEDSGIELTALKVDGGACVSDIMMQFQADLLNAKLIRPKCLETTALGACYLAGLTTGVFESIDQIKKMHQVEQVFVRNISDEELYNRMNGWNQAISSTLSYKIKNN